LPDDPRKMRGLLMRDSPFRAIHRFGILRHD
jgi:hypothetical protein